MDRAVVGTVAMDQGVVSAVVVDWVVVSAVVVDWVVADVLVDQGMEVGMVEWIVVGGARQINPSGLRLVWSLFQIWRMLEY